MPGGRGNKTQNALLRRIMQNQNVSRESAIRIAKSRGMIKQEGQHLSLTDKGRNPARKAQRHLQSRKQTGGRYAYNKKKERWRRRTK